MEAMEQCRTLADLPLGASASISNITAEPMMAARLAQFGMIPDTKVECVLRSSGGASAAFSVRGVVIALRDADCKSVRITQIQKKQENAYTVLLAGNPNVGKSTVFNALTGMRQHTGNWCGKTVESAKGTFFRAGQTITLIDTPGTYALSSQTAEEAAAAKAIAETPHDCVICVCDATALERGLILVMELLTMHQRVVLCVNLMDEAKRRGISVDLDGLAERLGIPVVGVTARRKNTLEPLMDAVLQICRMPQGHSLRSIVAYPLAIENTLQPLAEAIDAEMPENAILSPRWAALQLLQNEIPAVLQTLAADAEIQQARATAMQTLSETNTSPETFHKVCHAAVVVKAAGIAQKCTVMPPDASAKDRAADRIITSRRFGIPLMLFLLLLIFWLTVKAANVPSALLFQGVGWLCEQAGGLADALHAPWWLKGALVDGVLHGTGWVISVMLPPMAIFFPLFTLLEDAGLLPRLAFCADGCFAGCKACGKQALTMAMGLGCNAVGVTECRIIDSKRERLTAILTNSFMPCNGRFPSLLAISAIFFAQGNASWKAAGIMTLLIVLSVGMTMAVSWGLGRTILRGTASSFVLELPPYRRPQFGKVIVRSLLDRTIYVLGRAAVTAVPVSLLIWCMANVRMQEGSVLQWAADMLSPLGRLLGMDGTLILAFLLGIPANEIVLPVAVTAYMGSAQLTDYGSLTALHSLLTEHGWTFCTAICFLVFTLFHSPCATTLLTIRKETHSAKWTLAAFLLPIFIGMVLCCLVRGFTMLIL